MGRLEAVDVPMWWEGHERLRDAADATGVAFICHVE